MLKRIKDDLIMVIIVSLIGFIFEDLWMLVRYSVLDNRNMYLPFLLGYGLFVVALYYIIGTPKKIFNKYKLKTPINYLVFIIICFIFVSIGEILLGTFYEKIGHFHYWNYNHVSMHITRYTSIPTSLGFSLVLTFFLGFIYEPINKRIKELSKKIPLFIVVLVLIILIIDLSISFRTMSINKGRNRVWKIVLKR